MYHELIERLTLRLAKSQGYEFKNIHCDNARAQMYLQMAHACLNEIATFLEEEEEDFDNLEVLDRYQMPCILAREER